MKRRRRVEKLLLDFSFVGIRWISFPSLTYSHGHRWGSGQALNSQPPPSFKSYRQNGTHPSSQASAQHPKVSSVFCITTLPLRKLPPTTRCLWFSSFHACSCSVKGSALSNNEEKSPVQPRILATWLGRNMTPSPTHGAWAGATAFSSRLQQDFLIEGTQNGFGVFKQTETK